MRFSYTQYISHYLFSKNITYLLEESCNRVTTNATTRTLEESQKLPYPIIKTLNKHIRPAQQDSTPQILHPNINHIAPLSSTLLQASIIFFSPVFRAKVTRCLLPILGKSYCYGVRRLDIDITGHSYTRHFSALTLHLLYFMSFSVSDFVFIRLEVYLL